MTTWSTIVSVTWCCRLSLRSVALVLHGSTGMSDWLTSWWYLASAPTRPEALALMLPEVKHKRQCLDLQMALGLPTVHWTPLHSVWALHSFILNQLLKVDAHTKFIILIPLWFQLGNVRLRLGPICCTEIQETPVSTLFCSFSALF